MRIGTTSALLLRLLVGYDDKGLSIADLKLVMTDSVATINGVLHNHIKAGRVRRVLSIKGGPGASQRYALTPEGARVAADLAKSAEQASEAAR